MKRELVILVGTAACVLVSQACAQTPAPQPSTAVSTLVRGPKGPPAFTVPAAAPDLDAALWEVEPPNDGSPERIEWETNRDLLRAIRRDEAIWRFNNGGYRLNRSQRDGLRGRLGPLVDKYCKTGDDCWEAQ
jgi:hypothetical protein